MATRKIINFGAGPSKLPKKSNEVKNSNAMELEGLKRSLMFLEDTSKLSVKSLTTDRHVQVKKFMRTEKPDVQHWFDAWHVAKSVIKKLKPKAKKKDCQIIGSWTQSISNHLYWCAASSGGNGELFLAKWDSIASHITNVHEGHSSLFPKCLHGELHSSWILAGSRAHKEILQVIQKKHLTKDLAKLSPVDQTSHLEAFHKIVCFFAPKSVHYTYPAMYARIYLAVLHFNENCDKKQSVNKAGEPCWSVSFPKSRGGDGVIKPVKGNCTYDYVNELLAAVVELREQFPSIQKAKAEAKKHDANAPQPVCHDYENYGTTNKSNLISSFRTRFNRT